MDNSTAVTNTTVALQPDNYLFNVAPKMERWEMLVLAAFCGLIGVAVAIPNYLTLRALHSTKALLCKQKHFIGSIAMADFLVGIVSIPSFLYNIMKWPSFSYVIYEGVDSMAGFASIFSLAGISIQTFNEVVRVHDIKVPDTCSQCLILLGIWFTSMFGAAINVVCIMDIFPSYFAYSFYFYVMMIFLCITGLIILVTCFSVMAKTCVKDEEVANQTHSKDNANTFDSVFTVMLVYIIFWMFPYIYFTYNRICSSCQSNMSVKYLFVIRIFMYLKCVFNPIIYFNKIIYFSGAIMRILTRECFGFPSG